MSNPNVGEPVTVWGEDGIGVSLHRDYGCLVIKAGPGATLTPGAWEKVRAEGDRLIAEAQAVEAARLALEAGEVPPVAECGYCTTRITLLGGQWTADDGGTACTDTSAPFVPHKPAVRDGQ